MPTLKINGLKDALKRMTQGNYPINPAKGQLRNVEAAVAKIAIA